MSICLDLGCKKYTLDLLYDYTRKYPLPGYVPNPSRAAKEDNVEERKNSEVKQFFGRAELRITVTEGQTDVEVKIVFQIANICI